jgi:uncharacterized UPF0146 family protein
VVGVPVKTDVFGVLRDRLLEQTASFSDDDFLIRGIWKVELAFRPNPAERTFQYTFWLAMTRGQGCCYCTGDDKRGRELVGTDARELIREQTCISIATLDSLYASIPRHPAAAHEIAGNSIEKTALRTDIIMAEARRLLDQVKTTGRCPRVVNVGVVGNVVRGLCESGCQVFATDLEREMVGSTVHGVTVEDGYRTLDYVRESDLAIVTGMTIATDTLNLIVEAAQAAGTRLLIFAETGANFGDEYCRTLGVDTVVSEPFPFYIFQGKSPIEVYRREQR